MRKSASQMNNHHSSLTTIITLKYAYASQKELHYTAKCFMDTSAMYCEPCGKIQKDKKNSLFDKRCSPAAIMLLRLLLAVCQVRIEGFSQQGWLSNQLFPPEGVPQDRLQDNN